MSDTINRSYIPERVINWEIKDSNRVYWTITATEKYRTEEDSDLDFNTNWAICIKSEEQKPNFNMNFDIDTQYDITPDLGNIWLGIQEEMNTLSYAILTKQGELHMCKTLIKYTKYSVF